MEQIGLIDEFKQDLQIVGLSRSAIEQYPRIIRLLYDFTGGNLLGVTEDVLVRYLAHLRSKNLSQVTIRRYFTTFGTFYDFLVMRKYIAVSPITSAFRKHYIRSRSKRHDSSQRRQCITVELWRYTSFRWAFLAGLAIAAVGVLVASKLPQCQSKPV